MQEGKGRNIQVLGDFHKTLQVIPILIKNWAKIMDTSHESIHTFFLASQM
jgi:hypothetical protein